MRVLVYTEAWGKGGIESFVSNEVRFLSSKGIQFEVFSTWCWKGYERSGLEGQEVPHRIVFNGYRPSLIKRTVMGAVEFVRLLKRTQFDAVHINTMNGMGFLYSALAQAHHVPVRIVHSHNSDYGAGSRVIKGIAHTFGKALFGPSATSRVACSREAGDYLFDGNKYTVINNGIETEKYAFSENERMHVREHIGMPPDMALFGSVGRLSDQKNPLFTVKVFRAIKELMPSCRFLIVGSGELKDEVDCEIRKLGLTGCVMRLDAVDDVSGIYSALDVLVMPSLFEGLPIVAVEAQCSGLPLLCSDSMSSEVCITNLVHQRSLDNSVEVWAKSAIELVGTKPRRAEYKNVVRTAGYSVEDTEEKLWAVLSGVDNGQ